MLPANLKRIIIVGGKDSKPEKTNTHFLFVIRFCGSLNCAERNLNHESIENAENPENDNLCFVCGTMLWVLQLFVIES